MYTKNIELVDITDWFSEPDERIAAFKQLESHWNKNRKIANNDMCSRIMNPISFEVNSIDDYVNAFHTLLQHDYAYKLAVRKPGPGAPWKDVNITRDEIKNFSKFLDRSGKYLEHVAKIAYEDKLKDNFVEIKFRNSKRGSAKIEFREHEGKLIGYQCVVPYHLENLFKLRKQSWSKIYGRNHGMWVPDESAPSNDDECPEGMDPLRWVLRGIK